MSAKVSPVETKVSPPLPSTSVKKPALWQVHRTAHLIPDYASQQNIVPRPATLTLEDLKDWFESPEATESKTNLDKIQSILKTTGLVVAVGAVFGELYIQVESDTKKQQIQDWLKCNPIPWDAHRVHVSARLGYSDPAVGYPAIGHSTIGDQLKRQS
jgi:hypothetical protein